MNRFTHPYRRLVGPILCATLSLGTQAALAVAVSMPTDQGSRSFDSASFASAFIAAPSGDYACFSNATLGACNASSLQLSVLGPDLTTGLTLGENAEVTLALPAIASGFVVWEAGKYNTTGDMLDTLFKVHTAAGWSDERSFVVGQVAPVQNDSKPSGYATNYATLWAADFGLAPDAVIDAVRIRSCCGMNAHSDLLAIAAVPEPNTPLLMLAGLLAVGGITRLRGAGARRRG